MHINEQFSPQRNNVFFQFATGVEPIIFGKPSSTFFKMAVEDIGLQTSEVRFQHVTFGQINRDYFSP